MKTQLEPLIFEMDVGAPVERVWRRWTDQDEVRSWFAPAANISAEPGGPYELFWEPDHPERNSTIGCRVRTYVPREQLAFDWKGPVEHAAVMNVDPPPTSVLVTFTPVGDAATQLRVEHGGWGEGPEWEAARAWHVRAWHGVLAQMQAGLVRSSDGDT